MRRAIGASIRRPVLVLRGLGRGPGRTELGASHTATKLGGSWRKPPSMPATPIALDVGDQESCSCAALEVPPPKSPPPPSPPPTAPPPPSPPPPPPGPPH